MKNKRNPEKDQTNECKFGILVYLLAYNRPFATQTGFRRNISSNHHKRQTFTIRSFSRAELPAVLHSNHECHLILVTYLSNKVPFWKMFSHNFIKFQEMWKLFGFLGFRTEKKIFTCLFASAIWQAKFFAFILVFAAFQTHDVYLVVDRTELKNWTLHYNLNANFSAIKFLE